MSNEIELEVTSQNPASSMSSSDEVSEEREPLLNTKKQEEREISLDIEKQEERELPLDIEKQEERKPFWDIEEQEWDSTHLKPRHTIFLSHSGAQKNFVEQLCVDLEAARQAPFFDKRPDSLPKGQKFAQLIFQAARQCRLAIVVVSEEYFIRSKWPMLELAAFVEAGKRTSKRRCTILPLFLGLSCKEYGDATLRQRWFERWDEWAQEDPRIDVDAWKEALQELDGRNGMEYVAAFGEVEYRREVVSTSCIILQTSLDLELVIPPWVWYYFKMAALVLFYSLYLAFCIFWVIGAIEAYYFKVEFDKHWHEPWS